MQPQLLRDRLKRFGLHTRKQYHEAAFARNIGLFSEQEQVMLRRATVAIPGMGGVGGVHLVTMARTGIGRFHLADFDTFEPANVNRQYGARVTDLGKPKIEVMIDQALKINPYLKIKPFIEGVNEANMDEFLDGVQVVLDGLDFFQFEIRRQLFNRAREKGVYVITAAPLGFSSALLIFSPHEGMSFDEYLDIQAGMTLEEKYLAFILGLAPRATHFKYMDTSKVSLENKAGPSLGISCQICSGMAATEAVRIILKRGKIKPVPYFSQFDPYAQKYRKGKLYMGNRNPIQKIKTRLVKHMLVKNSGQCIPAPPEIPQVKISAGPLPEKVLHYIIKAGIQAPSGDNAQPWKFTCKNNEINLYLDRDADHSFFNVNQIASIISCGAVLENMKIAANSLGLMANIHYLRTAQDEDLMASVDLTPSDAEKDPLSDVIWKRDTNRKFYTKRPLPASFLSELEETVAETPGARLHVVTDKPELKKLASLIYNVDRIRTEHRPLHEHLCKMIRYTDEEAIEKKDGLPIKNLEAGFAGEVFLKITRPWTVMQVANKIGVGRMVALHAMGGMLSASGAALLTVDGMAPRDFLIGGQALERIWLTINKQGLCMQPMTAITLFRMRWVLEGKTGFSKSHQKLLEQVWGNYQELFPSLNIKKHGQVMLFRFGSGRPAKQGTYRKNIESFVKS